MRVEQGTSAGPPQRIVVLSGLARSLRCSPPSPESSNPTAKERKESIVFARFVEKIIGNSFVSVLRALLEILISPDRCSRFLAYRAVLVTRRQTIENKALCDEIVDLLWLPIAIMDC